MEKYFSCFVDYLLFIIHHLYPIDARILFIIVAFTIYKLF